MSEYTREEILRLIEENGGPEGLDLSGKDLSGIDLSTEAIEVELGKARERAPGETPVWYHRAPWGIMLWLANLQGADMMGANLQGAILADANLQGAFLYGADLQKANLAGADLREAQLWYANLQEASLNSAKLQEAELQGADLRWVDLMGANLQGAMLRGSRLDKVQLFDTVSLAGAHFYRASLDDTQMYRWQLGGAIGEELEGWYFGAREAYLALKNNFVEIGRYDDAAWAYCKERRMEKMCSAPWRARKYYGKELPEKPNAWRLGWFYFGRTVKWAADWFVELLCDYGESIWRVLAWMLLVILGFAAYYQVSHAVVTSSQDAATLLWDHLIFSLGAFTTLQPARLQAARPGVELLTTIQAIIGISLAGLLGFVAGNRIRRS